MNIAITKSLIGVVMIIFGATFTGCTIVSDGGGPYVIHSPSTPEQGSLSPTRAVLGRTSFVLSGDTVRVVNATAHTISIEGSHFLEPGAVFTVDTAKLRDAGLWGTAYITVHVYNEKGDIIDVQSRGFYLSRDGRRSYLWTVR